jgi:hypothetical protein
MPHQRRKRVWRMETAEDAGKSETPKILAPLSK